MEALAIILEQPEKLAVSSIALADPQDGDIVVDMLYSGISSGTERLLWTGQMPDFPGMGYPLVPGYESVGRIVDPGPLGEDHIGRHVFIPGAACYGAVKGLFGGASSRVVVPADRAIPISQSLGEKGILLALAATAYHAVSIAAAMPDLIIGHGILGRLVARLIVSAGGMPRVWDVNPVRRQGADEYGYTVVDPAEDAGKKFESVIDVSGDSTILDQIVNHLVPGGVITLAGFYSDRVSFAFAPAFMVEASIRIAAEFKPYDMIAVKGLIDSGSLGLDGLISAIMPFEQAASAYKKAFEDPTILKMVLDWRHAR